jgi:restriction system protein
MALWLVRAGKHGEHEQRSFETSRTYLTWESMGEHDLSKAEGTSGILKLLRQALPDDPEPRLQHWARQISTFVFQMKPGDWVVLPRKTKAAIAVGEIEGAYTYDHKLSPVYRHLRPVKWLNWDVPRSVFDQDLLYSFGAFMTVCQISRNDAENRVRAIARAGWKAIGPSRTPPSEAEEATEADLERLGRDQIAKLLVRKFKGHGMARLVEAILKAQGYTTFRNPEGPDKGIDILAAAGPLGFGHPRICVQVKSQDAPVESRVLNELLGAMQNVKADQGLLVSWGGFKSSVDKDTAQHFFQVRLWDQDDLIDQLLEQYDSLDADLRAELPLKRIWTVASEETEE